MNQTIAAIATGPVSGPIGIIRISGPDTMAVIDRVFHPQDGSAMSGKPSRLLTYGSLLSRAGDVIDRCLVCVMHARGDPVGAVFPGRGAGRTRRVYSSGISGGQIGSVRRGSGA